MRKNDGWMNALFALILIAVPALVGYYFFLKDWGSEYYVHGHSGSTFKVAKVYLSTGAIWGVALGFVSYVAFLSTILIFTKVLSIESLNFNIPLTLVFATIFVTSDLPLYGRVLLVIGFILLAFPINIMVSNITRNIIKKNNR